MSPDSAVYLSSYGSLCVIRVASERMVRSQCPGCGVTSSGRFRVLAFERETFRTLNTEPRRPLRQIALTMCSSIITVCRFCSIVFSLLPAWLRFYAFSWRKPLWVYLLRMLKAGVCHLTGSGTEKNPWVVSNWILGGMVVEQVASLSLQLLGLWFNPNLCMEGHVSFRFSGLIPKTCQ